MNKEVLITQQRAFLKIFEGVTVMDPQVHEAVRLVIPDLEARQKGDESVTEPLPPEIVAGATHAVLNVNPFEAGMLHLPAVVKHADPAEWMDALEPEEHRVYQHYQYCAALNWLAARNDTTFKEIEDYLIKERWCIEFLTETEDAYLKIEDVVAFYTLLSKRYRNTTYIHYVIVAGDE